MARAAMMLAYQFGRFELRPATRQLLVDQLPAALGARAFDLLLASIERRDRLVTKDELLDRSGPDWSSRKTTCRSRSPRCANC